MDKRKGAYVAAGGFLGAGARYGIYMILPETLTIVGTFICNMIGCLLIGFLYEYGMGVYLKQKHWVLWGTGFCGGFTTMSAFASDIVNMGTNSQFYPTIIYLLVTWFLGICFNVLGMKIATNYFTSRKRVEKS